MDFATLFDLTGKNAMIVGGAGGLGKLVAEAFAVAGAGVCTGAAASAANSQCFPDRPAAAHGR